MIVLASGALGDLKAILWQFYDVGIGKNSNILQILYNMQS